MAGAATGRRLLPPAPALPPHARLVLTWPEAPPGSRRVEDLRVLDELDPGHVRLLCERDDVGGRSANDLATAASARNEGAHRGQVRVPQEQVAERRIEW